MATIGTRDDGHERFWDVAEPFLEEGKLVEGTMMGHQCLRSAGNDGFVATVERSSGNLVVKLPKDRVAALIEAGDGEPFAPAKKVFKEWVAIAAFDEQTWAGLLDESIAFVES
jgi:hypothetical protein